MRRTLIATWASRGRNGSDGGTGGVPGGGVGCGPCARVLFLTPSAPTWLCAIVNDQSTFRRTFAVMLVHVTVGRAAFANALGAMREWLDRNGCPEVRFETATIAG